jgi:uncharacterized membrane protein
VFDYWPSLATTAILTIFYINLKGVILKMETNNISTIATFAAICITGILAYFGYSVDQAQLATVLMSVITLIIAIWSSKNPNTLAVLGNAPAKQTMPGGEPVLNDEYEV